MEQKFVFTDESIEVNGHTLYRIKAVKTPSIANIKVLLTGEYVKEYFYHFASKVRTDNIYSNLSTVKLGENIQEEKEADKITIRLEPTLKNSTYGASFDNEGIGLKRLHIIDKGVVKNMWGSNAKSQYINKPVNGEQIERIRGEILLPATIINEFRIDDDKFNHNY